MSLYAKELSFAFFRFGVGSFLGTALSRDSMHNFDMQQVQRKNFLGEENFGSECNKIAKLEEIEAGIRIRRDEDVAGSKRLCYRILKSSLWMVLLLCITSLLILNRRNSYCVNRVDNNKDRMMEGKRESTAPELRGSLLRWWRNNQQSYLSSQQYRASGEEAHEIFEVSYPRVPDPSYGSPVYSRCLFNHSFGNSWNDPFVIQLEPPKVDFNKVVLTLNTSVNGVQYDRLAHLFMEGAEIWRTSTIEPGGKRVYSSFKKDVSTFLALFKKESQLSFMLNNALSDRLDGAFEIALYADFYFAEEDYEDDDILDIRGKPANHIIPLTSGSSKKMPLSYLSSQSLSVELPHMPINTTRLRLSVFTSGNGNEEFWYSNVLSKYTNRFPDNSMPGHGPVRIVNAYINGKKFATHAPEPVIFTGGISPAFWNPVVSLNAFDLPSIDLDITGLLPYMWNSNATGNTNTLEIEVSNGVGEISNKSHSVGSDWITSASLLVFENDKISTSKASTPVVDNRNRGDVTSYTPAKALKQIVVTSFDTCLSTDFEYKLKNGTRFGYNFKYITQATTVNKQNYKNNGDQQDVVHVGLTNSTVELRCQGSLKRTELVFHYPLAMSSNFSQQNNASVYDYNLVYGKNMDLIVNGNLYHKLDSVQNGTSTLDISSKDVVRSRNGSLLIKYKFDVVQLHPWKYKRIVDTINGRVTKDSVTDNGTSSDKDHLLTYILSDANSMIQRYIP